MKKLFALFMVVAMLSVAGSAMAADPTITSSTGENTLIVVAGNSKTLGLTAARANNGDLGPIEVAGPDWATFNTGTGVLTVNPPATTPEGSYAVTASVAELVANDTASHGSAPFRTYTTTFPIAVSVVARSELGKTTVIERVVTRVVSTVVETVQIISEAARNSSSVQTYTEVVRTVTETITTTVLTTVEGYKNNTTLANFWADMASTVSTNQTTSIATYTATTTAAQAIFKGITSTTVVTPRTNDKLKSAVSSVASTATKEQKLAAATAEVGAGNKALSAGEAVQPTESGTYSFNKMFGSKLYGTPIRGHRGAKGKVVGAAGMFFAAAADEDGVAFLNSKGESVDVIPGLGSSNDVMPGFVNMLVVMEANTVYEPVIFTPAEYVKLDDTSVDVEVNEIAYKQDTVIVDISSSGEAGGEVIVVDVEHDEAAKAVQQAIQADYDGAKTIDADFIIANTEEVDKETIEADDAEADINSLHVAARYGRTIRNLTPGTYYLPAKFTKSSATLASGAPYMLYPDGVLGGTAVRAAVRDAEGKAAGTSYEGDGYFVFVISSDNTIEPANYDNTLENPTIAIELQGSTDKDEVLLAYLRSQNYLTSANTLTPAAFGGSKPAFTLSGDKYIANVILQFDVIPSSWRATASNATNNGNVQYANLSPTTATIQFDKSLLAKSGSEITLYVRPAGVTGTEVSASLGKLEGDKEGVGSSSGGCSAGFAGLALAVLGSFVLTRKR